MVIGMKVFEALASAPDGEHWKIDYALFVQGQLFRLFEPQAREAISQAHNYNSEAWRPISKQTWASGRYFS
jgi:hypothetical protein